MESAFLNLEYNKSPLIVLLSVLPLPHPLQFFFFFPPSCLKAAVIFIYFNILEQLWNEVIFLVLKMFIYCYYLIFWFRYYIQPQWVYDCVNAKIILPVEDYFMGVTLPPHLSPFVEEKEGDYMPPEKLKIMALQRGEKPGTVIQQLFTHFTQVNFCITVHEILVPHLVTYRWFPLS